MWTSYPANAPPWQAELLGRLYQIVAVAPYWVPIVLLAYVIGRRRVGLLFLFVAIAIEGVVLAGTPIITAYLLDWIVYLNPPAAKY